MDRKRVLSFALGPVVAAILGFLTLPLVAHFFSAADIGRLNVLTVVVSLSVMVFSLGLDQGYVRDFHETKNKSGLFKVCYFPGLVLILVVAAITFPFASEISSALYGSADAELYTMTSLCVISAYTSRFLSLIVRMQERGLAYSVSQILPKIVFGLLIIAYVQDRAGAGYHALVFAQLLSMVSVVGVFGWNTRHVWISGESTKTDRSELRRLLQFGVPLIGVGLASWGLNATSTIVLRGISTFHELGIYSMAMSFAGAATLLQAVFATIWMPTVYKWAAQGEDLARIDDISDKMLAIICLILAAGGALSWIIDDFIPEEYSQVKYIMMACMAQPLFYTLSETTVVGINITRRTIFALAATACALLVNLFLNYLLVPKFGASGAASANAVAFFSFFVFRTEASARVWRPIPRAKAYLAVGSILIFSVLTALYGDRFIISYSIFWSFLALVIVLFFWRSFRSVYAMLQGS